MSDSPKNVALFITCLVDLFRPSVGFAAIKLMEEAGCKVSVPEAQTCCGQPAYNSGDKATTAHIAKNVLQAFENYDFIRLAFDFQLHKEYFLWMLKGVLF